MPLRFSAVRITYSLLMESRSVERTVNSNLALSETWTSSSVRTQPRRLAADTHETIEPNEPKVHRTGRAWRPPSALGSKKRHDARCRNIFRRTLKC